MTFPNNQQMVGSSSCGPVSLYNIYEHFGIKTSLHQILNDLKIDDKKATYPAQLAVDIKKHGLSTILLTSSPRLVAPNWVNHENKEIIEKLSKWLKKHKNDKWSGNVKHLLTYLKHNGDILITDLTTKLIDEYLDQGYLVMPCLEDSWIWGQRKIKGKAEFDDIAGEPRGHFVVVYGKEDNEYLVSDPYPTGLQNREGIYRIDKDKLLVATLFWSATIVAVKNES